MVIEWLLNGCNVDKNNAVNHPWVGNGNPTVIRGMVYDCFTNNGNVMDELHNLHWSLKDFTGNRNEKHNHTWRIIPCSEG